MADRFDVIVIGSGFGGAIMGSRLAEKGHKVLILERGRRWAPTEYPRDPGDPWMFDPARPHRENGWIDFRFFDDMGVIQGAGVGGGSLIYANISVEAPEWIFEDGWPDEITYDELAPHYATVGKVMNVQKIPQNQVTKRYNLMKEGAEAIGEGHRFRPLELAVSFDDEWSYDLENPFDHSHSKTFTNAQGQEQGTCVHLGLCDLGCPVKAKNTLDLTYIPLAERAGAEVRPLHMARVIEPLGSGYRVHFDRISDGKLVPGTEDAAKVVIAAGSLGSTELLFRCRDQYKTLPGISRFLGQHWSANGDFLTPAFYDHHIDPTQGPTISSAIDFLDGSQDGVRYFIEDGGFPDLLESYLRRTQASAFSFRPKRILIKALSNVLKDDVKLANAMPWFAQGIDAANGTLYMGRKWFAPWKKKLKLDWDIKESQKMIDGILAMHKKLSKATGGRAWPVPTWTILKNLVTPHPLGGCNIGSSPANGVVDHAGRVFGYENLFVVDSAIIPEAIGRNPTRTIGALAERAAAMVDS